MVALPFDWKRMFFMNERKRFAWVLLFCFGWLCCAQGITVNSWRLAFARDAFTKASHFYEDGEFDQAFSLFQKSADSGFAPAQVYLGIMYEAGRGVAKSLALALDWYCKAAEQNHPDAYFNLGRLCLMRGDERGMNEAYRFFRMAADGGHVGAYFNLGLMNYNGSAGIGVNQEVAVEYLTLAGEAGHVEAQAVLGNLYENGLAVEKDVDKAITWYLRAAAKGHLYSQCCLGDLYLNGARPDPEQAVRWYLRAAEAGQAEAQFNLGRLYETGRGVEQNLKAAAEWYKKAADQAHPAAGERLLTLLENNKK